MRPVEQWKDAKVYGITKYEQDWWLSCILSTVEGNSFLVLKDVSGVAEF